MKFNQELKLGAKSGQTSETGEIGPAEKERITKEEALKNLTESSDQLAGFASLEFSNKEDRQVKEAELEQDFFKNLDVIKTFQHTGRQKMQLLWAGNCFLDYQDSKLRAKDKMSTADQKAYAKLLCDYGMISNDGKEILTQHDIEFLFEAEGREISPDEAFRINMLRAKIEVIQRHLSLPEQWKKMNYVHFDPDLELLKIKFFNINADRNEKGKFTSKKGRLAYYKETLLSQKEGIARMIDDLEKRIRKEPDITEAELMNLVYLQAPRHRLSSYQLFLFQTGIRDYCEKHSSIGHFRQAYPDDRELFKKCFGEYPESRIEVIQGPVSLYFRCFGFEDFAFIHSKKKSKQDITKFDKREAEASGGVQISECLIPELEDCITVEKARDNLTLKHAYNHEELHVFQEIIPELAAKSLTLDEIRHIPLPQKKWMAINSLRTERFGMEESAKDEILAYYNDDNSFKSIIDKMLKKDGLYDYFQIWRKDDGKKMMKLLKEEGIEEYYIKQFYQRVFIDEYQEIIVKAVLNLKQADEILRKRKWTKRKITYFFQNENLGQWGNAIKRIE
jgi:hypothetical protein